MSTEMKIVALNENLRLLRLQLDQTRKPEHRYKLAIWMQQVEFEVMALRNLLKNQGAA